jgi:hypothetical protein
VYVPLGTMHRRGRMPSGADAAEARENQRTRIWKTEASLHTLEIQAKKMG